ncbi:MAG: 16S rRNA (cytosine(1402)-N(4))-methyltransferase RsmH, partial [Chitinivibrionia bacterium]|nr:16S rRNA (cytosine(1402)-N(4))-methyltransferase RsmH [Chitinivibrionia bacterium]
PVMVTEVIRLLLHQESKLVLDGTVGCGGHAEAVLDADPRVALIGIDRDETALEEARNRLRRFGGRVSLEKGSYADLESILGRPGGGMKLDGILLDLGLSTLQLADSARGFSHQTDGPLDMRMGGDGPTARQVIAQSSVEALAEAIGTYGEVRRSRAIARAIKEAHREGAMETTFDLRNAVERALGHAAAPSTLSQVFQAIRILVNRELANIRAFLEDVFGYVNRGARMVFISYHSLEDREIKQFMRRESAGCLCPPAAPACVCNHTAAIASLTKRAVRPPKDEIARNPRARSARLRAAQVL